jgi:hypothetical protein
MSNNASGSSWAEYQRLVLAELERNNKWMQEVDKKLQEIQLQIAVISRTTDENKNNVGDSQRRIIVLESAAITEDAVKKYKKWVVGLVFTVVVSLVVPLVKLLFFGG